MATKVAQRRLQKEYLSMQKAPPPFIWACPEENNILNLADEIGAFHRCKLKASHSVSSLEEELTSKRGPPDTVYAGGEYHGLIWFPSDYPFKPPDVKMFTPSGRFEVGAKICMSMTSYHPSTWNAAWSVATILTGLLSFMLGDDITAGAVRTTEAQKKTMAKESHAFNLKSKKFRDVFPAYATPEMTDLPDMGKGPNPEASSSSTASIPTPSQVPTSSLTPTSKPEPAPVPVPETKEADTIRNVNIQQQQEQPGGSGWLSWRLVVVVAVLAVLGRLSIYAGRT